VNDASVNNNVLSSGHIELGDAAANLLPDKLFIPAASRTPLREAGIKAANTYIDT